jgi:hypothetical protein
MMFTRNNYILLIATAVLTAYGPPASAQVSPLSGGVQTHVVPIQHASVTHRTATHVRNHRVTHYRDDRTYWQRHPMQKGAAIGGGVGAAGGAIAGLISGRGLLRGAAIGAGTGAGVGVVRTSQTMKRHPVVRDTATGGLVGLGLGWASSRRGSTIGKTAGVGAAGGFGYALLKDLK